VLAGLAGLGAAAVTGACGSSDPGPVTTGGATTAPGDLTLVAQFDPNSFAVAGLDQRLVLTVVDRRNAVPGELPPSLDFTVVRDGAAVGSPITTTQHADGVPKPYFPLRTVFDTPGVYQLRAPVGDHTLETAIKVSAAQTSRRPEQGQPLPVTDTPTTDDARGVTPICTQEPACALHDVNLRDALGTGRPVALMVSTPRYCQIGVCGPVLSLLLEAQPAHPDVQFIHAEVYTDPESGSQDTAPIIDALGLDYEPALFIVAGDGTIRERLDIVFDRAEIDAALNQLGA
jgi:hypothetical protein